jgi:hypothetical protein
VEKDKPSISKFELQNSKLQVSASLMRAHRDEMRDALKLDSYRVDWYSSLISNDTRASRIFDQPPDSELRRGVQAFLVAAYR